VQRSLVGQKGIISTFFTDNKQGFSLRFIAKTMGRSVSTINREVKRNTGKRNHRPKQAHEFAQQRHQNQL
jgi:IS30 family transposase